MNRRRGWLWIGGGVFLALFAGALIFIMMIRVTAPLSQTPMVEAGGPPVQVVVAARDIPQHTLIKERDVSFKEVPAEAVPDEALLSVGSALGRIAEHTISSGEILVANSLFTSEPRSGEVAFTSLGDQVVLAQEDQILLAIPPLDLMSTQFLMVGNHVDILVSLQKQAEEGEAANPEAGEAPGEGSEPEMITAYTIQNAEVAAVKRSGGEASLDSGSEGEAEANGAPQALLMALAPQDALILKHLIDRGAIIDMALRAPTQDQLFDTQPVDTDYLYDRYRLPH